MFIPIAVLLCLVTINQGDTDCDRVIKESGLVPYFADGVKSTEVAVFFEGYRLKCGGEYSEAIAEYPPACAIQLKDLQCEFMTFLLFSTGPTHLHWVVYNIPAGQMRRGFLDDWGDVEAEYEAPKVSSDGSKNCTVFIYCQPYRINRMDPERFNNSSRRAHFPVKSHAKYYGLGAPEVATTFKLNSN